MNTQKTIVDIKQNQSNSSDLFLILQPNMFIDSGNMKRIEEKISKVQTVLEDVLKRVLGSGAKAATMVVTNNDDVIEQGFTGDLNKTRQAIKFGYGLYSSFLPCENVRKIIASSQKPVVTLLITDGWLFNTDEAAVALENSALSGNNHLIIVSLNNPSADLGILPHDKIFLERLEDAGAQVHRVDNIEGVLNKIKSIVGEQWISADSNEDAGASAPQKPDVNAYVSKLLNTLLDVSLKLTGAESGSIMTLDKATNKLSVKAYKGLNEEVVKNASVKMGEGISGMVAQDKQPLIIDDKTKDVNIKERLSKPWLKSSIVVPLQMGPEGDSFGVMNVSSAKELAKLNQESALLLEELAKLVGIAVEKSGWHSKV